MIGFLWGVSQRLRDGRRRAASLSLDANSAIRVRPRSFAGSGLVFRYFNNADLGGAGLCDTRV